MAATGAATGTATVAPTSAMLAIEAVEAEAVTNGAAVTAATTRTYG